MRKYKIINCNSVTYIPGSAIITNKYIAGNAPIYSTKRLINK